MDNQKRTQELTELKDLILTGLIEKLKSGKARSADYANAIKLLREYRELEDGAGIPGQPYTAFIPSLPFTEPFKEEDGTQEQETPAAPLNQPFEE
jgi:hypothetical protein